MKAHIDGRERRKSIFDRQEKNDGSRQDTLREIHGVQDYGWIIKEGDHCREIKDGIAISSFTVRFVVRSLSSREVLEIGLKNEDDVIKR